MHRSWVFVVALLLSALDGLAQNAPKYSNEFLMLGVGARGFAMSRAQTGITMDATSGYWNPAGLTEMDGKYQGSLMHSALFAGIAKYDYLGFGLALDSVSALGVTLIRLGIDDIPDTRYIYDANGSINYDNIQFFSAADYAFLFSYSRKMSFLEGLSLGANAKVIYRNVGSFATAWGFGLDVGARYTIRKWMLGLMFRDITGTFTAWSHNSAELNDIFAITGNELPDRTTEITLPRLIIGGGKRFVIKQNWGVLPALDLIMTFDGARNTLIKSETVSIEPAFGLEMDYKQVAFLRFGAGGYQKIKNFDGSTSGDIQPSLGLGIRINMVDVDYALTDAGNQSDALLSHIFSVTVRIDK